MSRKRKKLTPARKRKREQKRARRRNRAARTPGANSHPISHDGAQTHETIARLDRVQLLSMLQEIPPWARTDRANEIILDVLQDDSAAASERLLAAKLAGQGLVNCDEVATIVVGILLDVNASEKLRGRAAISLGPALEHGYTLGFDDPEDLMLSEAFFHQVTSLLQRLYHDAETPDLFRHCVLETAVRAPADWQRDAVQAAYLSEVRDWRITAVFCMRFIRGFEREILESLDSSDQHIHNEAVLAACNWEIDAAWSYLVSLLTDFETEKYLRLAIIEACAYIRPAEARLILVDLTDEDDEDIVDAAQEAMVLAEMMARPDDSEECVEF